MESPMGLVVAAVVALGQVAAFAQDEQPASSGPGAEADGAAGAEIQPEAKRLPLGYLSDPDTPAANPVEALFTGKISLDNRSRVELADTTGRDSSTAITNRLRLGYGTKPYHGFSGFVEMESNLTPDKGNYFVPQTGDGTPSRTVVADPPGTELNQAYGRFALSRADAGFMVDVRVGRQRIKLDDDRFIGNVGWRQLEQTFDAVSVKSDLGIEALTVFYAYAWEVRRIFGNDGPNPDSDSHFINVSYRVAPELRVTPFVYLLDFKDDEPANSVNNYGVRLSGEIGREAEREGDVYFDYALTYARQTDAGSNPVDYEADFFAAQVGVHRPGTGSLIGGYQLLGSDDGRAGFRFPLGTNHAFQGFADQFLVTPADGLQDLYVTLAADLPWGVKGSVSFHQFWTDEGGTDLGHEVDFVLSKALTRNWSVMVKGAFFDGHNGQPDTTRAWFMTTFAF